MICKQSTVIMDGYHSWIENLSIYGDNLCTFYVASVIISLLFFVIAYGYNRYEKKELKNSMDVYVLSHRNSKDSTIKPLPSDDSIMMQMKTVRQSALMEQVAAGLTEDQLKKEREAEAEQLAAIFQLLRNQEDKFHVGSMEELEEQLRLYRH